MGGYGLLGLRTGRRRRAAVRETLAEEARGEAIEVQRLGARRVDAVVSVRFGKAAHALDGGVGLLREVARGHAALGPGQRVLPDSARPLDQDLAVVRPADVAHGLEAVGHVVRVRRVFMAPGLERMDGEALAALLREHFEHALSDPHRNVAAVVALGYGVVVPIVRHVTVLRHLAG